MTDHKELATVALNNALNATSPIVQAEARELALVYATLHVGEQQRIANILAYWQMHVPRSAAEAIDHHHIDVHDLETHDGVSVDFEVRLALGI